MQVIKNYPNYEFIKANGRKVSYSINGDSPLIGWTGRPVKNFPIDCTESPFGIALELMYRNLNNPNGAMYQRGKKMIDLLDKLVSIDAGNLNLTIMVPDFDVKIGVLDNLITMVDKYNFKKFLLAYNNIRKIESFANYILSYDFIQAMHIELFKVDHPGLEISPRFELPVLQHLEKFAIDNNISFKKIINLYNKHVYCPMGEVMGFYEMSRIVDRYINYCIDLHWDIETGDFFKNYLKAEKTHQAMKEKIDNERFAKNQVKRNLVFEDENFITIVPTTREECIKEGSALHNCLGNFEWNSFLSKGYRNVVFVRNKTDIKRSYIACDIDIASGRICQYLTYNNSSVRDPLAQDFKKAYQAYLLSIWRAEG